MKQEDMIELIAETITGAMENDDDIAVEDGWVEGWIDEKLIAKAIWEAIAEKAVSEVVMSDDMPKYSKVDYVQFDDMPIPPGWTPERLKAGGWIRCTPYNKPDDGDMKVDVISSNGGGFRSYDVDCIHGWGDESWPYYYRPSLNLPDVEIPTGWTRYDFSGQPVADDVRVDVQLGYGKICKRAKEGRLVWYRYDEFVDNEGWNGASIAYRVCEE